MQIKKRDVSYCNLKLLLIFLVVYGHVIEPWIGDSAALALQYRLIYSVHMPLFVFLSGLFLKKKEGCLRQMLRMLRDYVIVQGIMLFAGPALLDKKVVFCVPYWHFWYLLSLAFWSGAAFLWHLSVESFRWMVSVPVKLILIGCAAAGGCAAGCVGSIGRVWSLSRSIAFFPYLLAGVFCPADIRWSRYRLWGLLALLAGGLLFLLIQPELPVSFLYHAAPYGTVGNIRGVSMRFACYLTGGLLSFFLLTWIPQGKLICSRAGMDTMGIYLCHAFLVLPIRQLSFFTGHYAAAGFLCSIAIVLILYEAFRWRSHIFVLVSRDEYLKEKQVRSGGERDGGISGYL